MNQSPRLTYLFANLIFAALIFNCASSAALADEDGGVRIQQQFDAKFKNYMGSGSDALLPLPKLEKPDWEKLRSTHAMKQIFVERDVFYNAKTYTLTLFQAEDGSYYLDAKGGFWGMDELIYGPFDQSVLQ
ncbi:UPF0345 protein [Novimethylophilus kurashikiensis]|uniref:UPF0345 protein n=1 Tax=Novimethylophilus kurashikiensis TaxID=1825523 RepID=A0A2R5F2C2_9PROT|nr:hypothetical protein [Novimethylophilus kurashikiensis]GBG12770.1 UPF0345 protein [Novimethylophilus kurashikiensis]